MFPKIIVVWISSMNRQQRCPYGMQAPFITYQAMLKGVVLQKGGTREIAEDRAALPFSKLSRNQNSGNIVLKLQLKIISELM